MIACKKKGIKLKYLNNHPQQQQRYSHHDSPATDDIDTMHDDQWEAPELQFQSQNGTSKKPNTNNAANLKKNFPYHPVRFFM